ncbi:hypothetical protein E2C01_063271 [Portunus trituberculatus]|uniref:Uncharacterized protein n=1 Tax=Portunus trituberculatus TaxID=210409 RepID=A0A5B7HJU9_PORTR|nr:hypothetical protein [Portunus trituberculatus]
MQVEGHVCVIEVNTLTLTVSGCGGKRRLEMSGSGPAEDATATGRYCGRLRNVQVKDEVPARVNSSPTATCTDYVAA